MHCLDIVAYDPATLSKQIVIATRLILKNTIERSIDQLMGSLYGT